MITKVLVDNIYTFWSADLEGLVYNWKSNAIISSFRHENGVYQFHLDVENNILTCGLG